MSKFPKLLLVLILLVFSTQRLDAAVLCVNPTGVNGCYSSIQAAINAASPGNWDTISIDAGTYYEALSINKNITLQGKGTGLTILDGQNSFTPIVVGQYGNCCSPTVWINGFTIQRGYTSGSGGAIVNYGSLMLTQSAITNSNAALDGGAIFNYMALGLDTVMIANNSAGGSGGGILDSASLSLHNVLIDGNTAGNRGGGLSDGGTNLQIDGSTMSNNSAGVGGGIATPNGSIYNSAIISNTARSGGGGLYITESFSGCCFTQLVNVTVSGNRILYTDYSVPYAGGGGILNEQGLMLTNVTIASNSATFNGGGIAMGNQNISASVTTKLKNTILALNSPSNCLFQIGRSITSLGHNLTNTTECSFDQPTDLNNTDPLVLPLANNGGATFTQALIAGSPAIDTGDNSGCLSTDQRGYSRDAHCDIGAYEYKIFSYYFPLVIR